MPSSVSFVSCYIRIYEKNFEFSGRTDDWRMSNFLEVAKTGIPLIVYVCSSTRSLVEDACSSASLTNVCVIEVNLNDLCVYNALCDPSLSLPGILTETKDTREYMALMNTKIEFIKDAIERNPHNTTHFSWLDFSVRYILKNLADTFIELKSVLSILPEEGLFIPGCYEKENYDEENLIHNYCSFIVWRYCGTFFIGDKESLLRFYDISVKWLPVFVEETKYTTWEVNVWSWFESNPAIGWKPNWYKADHNDSMITNLKFAVQDSGKANLSEL